MQRAVEDPGVGCGGWWSVGEGMKGMLSLVRLSSDSCSSLLRSETATQKTASTVKATRARAGSNTDRQNPHSFPSNHPPEAQYDV